MYCQNCGKELPEGMKFCIECGTKLEMEQIETVKNDSVNSVTFDSSAASDSISDSQHISDIDGSENVSVSDFQTQNDNSREDTNADLMHNNSKNDQSTSGINKTINNKPHDNQFFISSKGIINNKKSSVFSKISNLPFAFKMAVLSVLGLIIVASVIFIKINSSSINNDLVVKGENNTGAAFNLTLDEFNKKFKDYLIKNYNEKCSIDLSEYWESNDQSFEEGSGIRYVTNVFEIDDCGVSLIASVADDYIIDLRVLIDGLHAIDGSIADYNCWQNLGLITYQACSDLTFAEVSTILGKLNVLNGIEKTARTITKENIAYTFFYDAEGEQYVLQASPVSKKYLKTLKEKYENEYYDYKDYKKLEKDISENLNEIPVQEIDIFKNIEVRYTGINGYATAVMSFPNSKESFGSVTLNSYEDENSLEVWWDYEIGKIDLELDKSEQLSNNEKINISLKTDDDLSLLLKLLGYYFKSETKEITVSGLKEGTVLDLLSEVEKYIRFWGANGDGEANIIIPEGTNININAQNVYFVYLESIGDTTVVFDVISDNTSLGQIKVKLNGNTKHLSSGETIKIEIDSDSAVYSDIVEKDIWFKEKEKEIVVPELGYYINSKDELSSQDIAALKKMALDALKESSSQDLYKDYKVEQVNFRTIKPTAINNFKSKGYVEVIAKKGNDKIHILLFDVVKNNEGVMGYCDSGFVFELEDNFHNNIFNRMNGIEDPGANYTSEKIG